MIGGADMTATLGRLTALIGRGWLLRSAAPVAA